VGRPETLAVPLRVRAPLAKGVPATGRTRTFCQVNVFVTPLLLVLVTVKVSWVEVTLVIARELPLLAPFMFFDAEPVEVIFTVGAVPPVSNTNPLGALRMIVPAPALPLAFSE
jgi:hypothetical protein